MLSLLLALQVHAGAPPEPLPVTLALDNGGFLQEFYWPQRGPYQGSGDWLPRASVMQDLAVSVAASSPGDFQLWVAQPPGIDPPEGPCRIEALAEARTASAWTGLDANYNGTTSTSLIALHRALGEEGPVCDTDDLADPLEGPRVEIYVFDLLEEDDREAFVADERERCIRPGRLAESISEVLAERPDHLWLGPDGNLYIAELGFRTGVGPDAPPSTSVTPPAGMKIMNLAGQWLGGWGMSTDTPGDILAGHAAMADSHGDLYVGETLIGARVQKFARVR